MPSKRQERREQIERQLLEATDRLMASGATFTELSVDRLATEAGISRATFYIYFEDKGHLLRRLTRQVFDDLASSGEKWWGVAHRRDPADAVTAIGGIVAGYRRHQALLVALNEMAAYDPQIGATYREVLNGIIARMTEVVEAGHADGSIRGSLPAAPTANSLVWMVERSCHQNLPTSPPSQDAQLTAALTQIVWGALYLEAL